MSFGWSSGDLFAASRFVLIVISALSESQGSAKDHSDVVKFLRLFQCTLTNIERDTRMKEIYDIDQETSLAIKENLEALKQYYLDLRDTIEKNAGLTTLEKGGLEYHLKRQLMKLKWEFFIKGPVQVLREKITQQISLLNPLRDR